MNDQKFDPQISAEFRKRRLRQFIAAVPVFFVFALLAFYDDKTQSSLGLPVVVVALLGGGLMIGALVFAFVNWRCPACNAYMGKKISPRYCSSCGVQLLK